MLLSAGYACFFVYTAYTQVDDGLNWSLVFFKTLPLRVMSRMWGILHHMDLPLFLRSPVYRSWIYLFNVNEEEMPDSNLKDYPNLNAFFTRSLKPNTRTLDEKAHVVAPADGIITVAGRVDSDNTLLQIKGMSYNLNDFLGHSSCASYPSSPSTSSSSSLPLSSYSSSSSTFPSDLYYCVVYLSPGDYHHFHASSSFSVDRRRHISGELNPVAPSAARRIPSLFARNERVVLEGTWKFGAYYYGAVGAYNVGSIQLVRDPELRTNHLLDTSGEQRVKEFGGSNHDNAPLVFKKGEEIGHFELGSTVVLVWEVKDADFHFTFDETNPKIKLGMPIGEVRPRPEPPRKWWQVV